MIRVSVTVHPFTGETPREVAAIVIARVGNADDGRYQYSAVSRTDGRDLDYPRGATVAHHTNDGALGLTLKVLSALSHDGREALDPTLREILESRLGHDHGS